MSYRPAVMALFFFLCCSARSTFFPAAAQTQSGDQALQRKSRALVLSQALSRVFESNPELTASELEIQAAAARILQAGLKPNPEISIGGENLAAMGGTGLFSYTESTFQVSQRLELGGKRALRVRAGEKEKALAGRMLELKKAELIAATSQAFAEVLADQERLANRQELSQLAGKVHTITVERVAAGKISPVEQTRTTVALASAQLEEQKQLRVLVAAKDRLAALWGGTHEDLDEVRGRFEVPSILSGLAESCLAHAPDLKVADAAVSLSRSVLELEQAARKPDLTISAGFRRLNLEAQSAWVAGLSIPLPLFDRRQGSIAEARIRIDKSLSEKRAAEWRLRASLNQALHEHESARMEVTSLTKTALPAAREALTAVEEGYRFGKFDLLNVLDAQRTYAELQGRYIEAVASGLKAAIEIERLARCDSQESPLSPAGDSRETTHEK